jgi:dinuclear metal center YbgI/SA1388 family protein
LEKLANILQQLESLAPPGYQESYDNSGLLTGSPEMMVKGVLICLDSTEEIIEEAIRTGCNLVIAHHPILFSGIKKLNGKNYVERTLIKAIKNDIAIYAIHTNLDNVRNGVNKAICDRIGLSDTEILSPKSGLLKKLVTYCPEIQADAVKSALFAAGAGSIGNYDECSFSTSGTGTFRGNESSAPAVGQKGVRHLEAESRIEVVFEGRAEPVILKALRAAHPYEEIAFDVYSLDNKYNNVGSGMIGELKESLGITEFLALLKSRMQTGVIKYTTPLQSTIKRVAVCGGSGSFLLPDAIRSGADAFVTADFKYHQFFDGEGKVLIADIGHYESEQFTKELIYNFLNEKFTTFALRLSELNTNPINYF